MTLKDLARVLPAYCTLHVHDTKDSFAMTCSPHEFTTGMYKTYGDMQVHLATPLASYRVEITVEVDVMEDRP